MDERRLKAVSEEKDLGISFNDNLTFEKHINEKVNKANSPRWHGAKNFCSP